MSVGAHAITRNRAHPGNPSNRAGCAVNASSTANTIPATSDATVAAHTFNSILVRPTTHTFQ